MNVNKLLRIFFLFCLLVLFLTECTTTPTTQPTIIITTPTPKADIQNIEIPTKVIPTSIVVSGTINWADAASSVGEYKTVCGPVMDCIYAASSDGQPTYLNLGRPKPNRFTVVIWGKNRSKFAADPEKLYSGLAICVTGLIEANNGVLVIDVSDPSQIEIR